MAATKAQLKANAKYNADKIIISFRVPDDGTREKYQEYAKSKGKSLKQLIVDLIESDMKKQG